MLEVIIIVGLIVLLVVSEFNPVLAVRKLWAALSFGIGATPKGLETAKAKTNQWVSEAREIEAREGKVYTKIGSTFRQQGKTWSEKELDPIIKQAKEDQAKADKALAGFLAKK